VAQRKTNQSQGNGLGISMKNEEFRKDIEKVEQTILDISLYSMPFIVAFLVKVVVL
tara:strand:+ start:246 stop:413 length:168 start_codon:yes stop_codon:yes gene_type:complete